MELLLKYFPEISSDQQEKFARMFDVYREWNEKINVISRKDMDHFYLHHVLHSLAIARYIQFAGGTKVMDVGTGGGFPGIPLAVFFPATNFTLVDSIGKKIKVVEAVIQELGLENCRAVNSRAENVKGSFDYVVSRAVTRLPEFISWVKNSVSRTHINSVPNGILALKGGDLSEETKIPYSSKICSVSSWFHEDYFQGKALVHVEFPPSLKR